MRSLAAVACLAAVLCGSSAAAQDYPARPIRVITVTSAGGTSDIFMRALGEELQKRWGHGLIVENRPGGNTIIGGRACAEAPKDGHTVCILPGEVLAFNKVMHRTLPYDAEKDYEPIMGLFFGLLLGLGLGLMAVMYGLYFAGSMTPWLLVILGIVIGLVMSFVPRPWGRSPRPVSTR